MAVGKYIKIEDDLATTTIELQIEGHTNHFFHLSFL